MSLYALFHRRLERHEADGLASDNFYRDEYEAAVARADAAEAALARLRLERCPGAHDGENESVKGCCEKCCPGASVPHLHRQVLGECRLHAGTKQAHKVYAPRTGTLPSRSAEYTLLAAGYELREPKSRRYIGQLVLVLSGIAILWPACKAPPLGALLVTLWWVGFFAYLLRCRS